MVGKGILSILFGVLCFTVFKIPGYPGVSEALFEMALTVIWVPGLTVQLVSLMLLACLVGALVLFSLRFCHV